MSSYTAGLSASMAKNRKPGRFFRQVLVLLALLLIPGVFWSLKLTGITMAGEAFCGMAEHYHSEECRTDGVMCPLEEHIHQETCYSDINADLETAENWAQMLSGVGKGPVATENLIAVTQSQLDYQESALNFQVDAKGIRRGITRYGQWYGNPYSDWSAMFVSFCLHYAGVENVPANAGAEAMRLEWEEARLYADAGEIPPQPGNILFLHKPDSTVVTIRDAAPGLVPTAQTQSPAVTTREYLMPQSLRQKSPCPQGGQPMQWL